jgi:signal peptidase II
MADPTPGDAPATPPKDAAPSKPAPAGPSPVLTPPGKPPSFVFLAVVSIAVLVSDLWSKWWAVKNLEKPGLYIPPKEIIKGRLSFVLARNPGGAWGMLHDQPEKVRKPFFVLVSIVAVVVILSMFRKLDPRQRALKWGLPLVLGGALGNLVDRIRYGKVIDFIDVVYWTNAQTGPRHWPTFNVADIAICVGVALMAIDFIFPQKRTIRVPPKKKPASAPVSAPIEKTADADKPAAEKPASPSA